MKSSKERKMDRKMKHKALAVSKTEQSRQRRVDNKTKRDEIHVIDPDMKIVIINEKTYDKDNIEVQVIDGKIINVLELAVPEIFESDPLLTVSKEFDQKLQDKINVIEKIKTKNRSALQRLTDRLRRKRS